jgi:hypothetical protein
VVGLGANLWLPRFEPARLRRLGKSGAMAFWIASCFAMARRWQPLFDARRARLGTDAEPYAYVKQFARMWFRDRAESPDGARDYLDALQRVRVPVLSIASAGDRYMAEPSHVSRFLDELRSAPVSRRVITRDDLDPPPGHMGLVLDARCRPLWDVAGRFLLAPSAQGQALEAAEG